jgi:hypothetical protein
MALVFEFSITGAFLFIWLYLDLQTSTEYCFIGNDAGFLKKSGVFCFYFLRIEEEMNKYEES